jgi:hypothetical protein
MRQGDALQSQASLPTCAEELIGTDGAGAKEDQCKRADKFSDKLLRRVVYGSAPEAN